MSNLAYANNDIVNGNNIIPFELIVGNKNKEEEYEIDDYITVQDKEVYAFRTADEIKAMIDVYDRHINEAENENQRKIARRNRMLFVIGINVGIRASDLRILRWNFFFDENGNFRDGYKLCPKKTRKHKKTVKLFFNDAVRTVINEYISYYPIEDMNGFLFQSRKGDEAINVKSMWRVIKDAAKEAGITQNIGSHSLRKTWAYQIYNQAKDKEAALVMLSYAFNHSSVATTRKYIGLMEEDISDMYNSINLGIDFI